MDESSDPDASVGWMSHTLDSTASPIFTHGRRQFMYRIRIIRVLIDSIHIDVQYWSMVLLPPAIGEEMAAIFDIRVNGIMSLTDITPDADIDDDQLPYPVRSLLTTEHHNSRGSASGECGVGLDQALARDWWDHADALSQEHHDWTAVLYPEKSNMARSMAEIFGGIFNLSYRMPGYDGSCTMPFVQAIIAENDTCAIADADIGAGAFVQPSGETQKARTALIVRCSNTDSQSQIPVGYEDHDLFELSRCLVAAFQASGPVAYSLQSAPLYKADFGLPAYGIHSRDDMIWFYRLDDPPERCPSSNDSADKPLTSIQMWTYPNITRKGLKLTNPNDRDAIVKALVSILQEIRLDNDEIRQQ